MAKIIKCKTCGADMATNAKSCPSCGAKNKKPIYTKWWFWVLVILIIGAGASGGGSDSNNTDVQSSNTNVQANNEEVAKPEEEVIVISAEELAKAFEDNEVKANQLYKDKMVEVTGTVSSIGEILGSTYITLDAAEDFALTQTQCFFDDEDQINKVASLSKGDTVTIVGKVDGKSINVGVDDCKFK